MGWPGLAHQLAEDCYAYFNQTTLLPWDSAWLNIPRLIKPEVPEELNIDALPCQIDILHICQLRCFFFTFRKAKQQKLKIFASPPDG